MRIRTLYGAVVLTCVAALGACSGGGTPHPAGWEPMPGPSPAVWTTGKGVSMQEYDYASKPYTGSLQDLASLQAVDVVLHRHGAKFTSSDVFAPCPGQAAVATFAYGKDRTLQQAFAVQRGQAVLITYIRPKNMDIDPEVRTALDSALCVAP